jgi:hypothetical protein
MLGWDQLKPTIRISKSSVECPVRDCTHTVKRQRHTFQRHGDFRCPLHGIYISPSTFEYENDSDNMLWTGDDDMALWRDICAPGVKRESRVTRDNSEDAVTWNVFRFIEKKRFVGLFVNMIAGELLAISPRVIYWSFCQSSHRVWQPLIDAAKEFGETIEYRTEPDVVIDDGRVLVFVESKFLAANRKGPLNLRSSKRYTTGGQGWFGKVFVPSTHYRDVAEDDELYQLMRLWLLGSWIASQASKRFILVNVLRSKAEEERDIESRFGKHIQISPERQFVRVTWEQLLTEFVHMETGTPEGDRLAIYSANKTIGYPYDARGDPSGVLQKAFDQAVFGRSAHNFAD